MSSTSTPSEIRQFLDSDANVCPWGRGAAASGRIVYCSLLRGPRRNENWYAIRSALGNLTRNVVDVVIASPPVPPLSHHHGFDQCLSFCVDLLAAFAPAPFDSQRHRSVLRDLRIRSQHAPWILVELLQSLPCPLFLIAMNPLYSGSHPRYAPSQLFVVTRVVDVCEAQASHAVGVDVVRSNIAARECFKYDGSLPYVWPPSFQLDAGRGEGTRSSAGSADAPESRTVSESRIGNAI
jgi:hypothetical protein